MTEQRGSPPPSKRQQMRDALNQVMQQAAEKRQEASAAALAEARRQRRRQQRGVLLLLLAAAGLAVSVAIMLPTWLHPFPPRTGAAAMLDARKTIVFAAKVVSGFEAAHERPPISLEETHLTLPGLTYDLQGSGYTITAMVDGKPLVYHSGMNRDSFLLAR